MMSAEIDELLEEKYAAQQEGATDIQIVEIDGKNEGKTDIEVSSLLIDISETLRLLNEQMIRLNEVTKTLPETVYALKTTTEAVQSVANELPAMVREQCLAEYKKILENAVKNYNRMQKAMVNWQKSMTEKWFLQIKLLVASAIVTPIVLFLSLIFK